MISLSPTLVQVLQQPTIEAFYLVEIGLATVYRSTSFYSDIVLTNGEVYVADGKLLAADPPQLSASVDREQYKIALVDSNMEFRQYFETLTARPIKVRVGFVDQTTEQPLLDKSNTVLIYGGYIDSYSYTIENQESGSVVLNLLCTSPMGDLDMKKTLYTNRDAFINIDAADTSFNQIYEDAGQIALKWGKA
jgi:hypothetical protein